MYHVGEIAQFVRISLNISSSYITCLFYHQSNSTKKCSFIFGLLVNSKANCKLLSSSNMSNTSTNERVYVGFSIGETQLQDEYCFTVTASNGTFTVIIEGSFVAGVDHRILVLDICDVSDQWRQ